jgi:hydrogenase nickel incorporation protein HypB
MCSICGCSGQTENGHTHVHHDYHAHDIHDQDHHAHDLHDQDHHNHSHLRLIEVEQNLLSKNNHYASLNHARFAAANIAAFNLVSSPGSGKTTLLTATIRALHDRYCLAVIEGDQQTDQDARRIRETGAQAVQINTGKGCHLDAHAVGHALDELDLAHSDFVMIENVGNLVCPAAFDLGELAKVVILSVTEGTDKPLKYPDMFYASALMIINKIDLLPYVDFDVEKCIEYARRIRPDIQVLCLSATSGEGMQAWLNWLAHQKERANKAERD